MPEPLKWRLLKMYTFLWDYREKHGYCPSMWEIAEGVGLRSVSTVSYNLRQLAEKGYIERVRQQPRAIRLLIPLDSDDDYPPDRRASRAESQTGPGLPAR